MKKIFTILSIIVVLIALAAVGVGVYFTRISTETRIFRLAGTDVGSYQAGRPILAKKITDHSSLKKDEVVVYTLERDGRTVTKVGVIYGLPAEKNLGKNGDIGLDENHFLVGQNEDRIEMVEKNQIGWKVVRQF